jgi:DNA-binding MurR/RpiR family transcriptional regulator
VASPSQEGLTRLGRIDRETLVIGFSAGRPHPLVLRAMKLARHRGARTVAIVDATLSEVAKLSDHALYYSSNSPTFVRSHTALLGLVQALAYGVYALDESAYADRIKAFKLK